MASITSLVRGPKQPLVKTRFCSIADTTARQIATLPKGARPLYIVVGGIASNGVTTATLGFGTTTAANEWVTGHDVKTAATGTGPALPKFVSGIAGFVLTADTPIFVKYADTGGAASVGSWYASIFYTTGNITDDDTVA